MAGREVSVTLRANVAQYQAAMASAASATEAAMGRASRAASRHEALFSAASKAVKVGGLTAAVGLGAAIKASADFEARMANVQTLSKATAAEMLALRAGAMHAGTGFGYTANQVADAEAEMIKAGIGVRDMMGGGLRGTLALAAAGQLDVADATTIAASAMTQFKLKGKDVPHIADLLAAGADKALGSVQDLGYGLSQAGTQSHQMGLSIEDTVGTLAEFAQAGLIGERGGTTLKMMLLRLANPSKQASKLMDEYGLSIYKANGQMKTMPEIAGNLTKAFRDLTPAQRNAALGTIFGARAIQGANILMAGGEKANRKWIRSVNDQGFAAEQASGKLDSLKGDWQKLKASGENALIELGSGSQSPLRGLVQGVTRDINKITRSGDLKRWGQEIGHDLDSIIHAAGPLAKDVGGALKTVGDGVGHVVDGFNKLPKGVQSALVTGGAVAYGAHKLGADSLLTTLVGGGKMGMLGKAGGVTPVVVTNWPIGMSGKTGLAAGAEGTLIGGASRGSRAAGALDRGLRSGVGFAALEVGSLVVHNVAPQRHFAAGALAGAGIGGMIGGVPGAAAGALIGGSADYLHSLRKNKPTAFDAQMNAPVSQADKLAKSYAKLYAAQEKIRKADPKGFQDALKVPSQASENADLMSRTLEKMHEVTGKSVTSAEALAMAMKASGEATAGAGVSAQKSMYDLAGLATQTAKVGISGQDTAKMLHSLPAYVQTKIETPGALQSRAAIQALGKQFDLTPRQIKSIITLVGARDAQDKTKATTKGLRTLNTTSAKPKVFADTGQADAKVKGVDQGLRTLNQQSAKPKVFAQDNASGTISHIKGEINSIPHSRTSTITVNHVTTYSTRGHPSAAAAARNPSLNKPAVPSAIGSLYSGRTRVFADGGYTDDGHYVPRVPQMRQGGGNVLWSEPETGWEAYISGKPGMRDRNLEIWRQAGERLGAQWEEYARGGIRDAFASGGHKGHKPLTHRQVRAADRAFNLAGGETTADVKSEFGDLRKAFHFGAKALRDMEHSALRLVKAYAKQETALDGFKEKLKSLKDARSEYAGSVTSAYTHDPFGNGLAGLKLQLEADRNDATSALGYSKILDKKHIGQGLQKALLASGDLNTLQQLSMLSAPQVATYSKLYSQSTGATSALGKYAGADQYNKAIASQTRLIHRQEKLIDRLEHKLDRLEGAVERGARRGVGDRDRATHHRAKNGK